MPNYRWGSDYSTFIDADKYPDAVWKDADPGGGSEGAPSRAGGFYTPDSWGSEGQSPGRLITPFNDRGTDSEGGPTADNKVSYQILKDAGLWNLGDLNSPTWKFLSGGQPGSLQNNPSALLNALVGLGEFSAENPQALARSETQLREMMAGLNPTFINQAVPAVKQYLQSYEANRHTREGNTFGNFFGDMGDSFSDLMKDLVIPFVVSAVAMYFGASGAGAAAGGAAGAGAAGAAEGAGAGAVAEGAGAGLAETFGISTPADLAAVSDSLASAGASSPGAFSMPAAVPQSAAALEGMGLTQTGAGVFENLGNTAAFGGALGGGGLVETASGPTSFPGEPTGQDGGPTGLPGAVVGGDTPPTNFPGEPTGQPGGPTGLPAPQTSPGIIDSVLKFGNQNPFLTSGLLQLGGGIFQGIANNKTANDVVDKRIAAEKELEASKLENAKALEEWKRTFIQGGSYFDSRIPFKAPAQPRQLRRPDGSLVHQPGIVAGAMQGGG